MPEVMIAVVALLVALAVDHVFGEPPGVLHPVVWMGRYLDAMSVRFAPEGPPADGRDGSDAFGHGALAWLGGAALFCLAAWLLERAVVTLPAWGAAIVLGLLLKPMLAWRMLRSEVAAVDAALALSLDAGRERLSRLCSRDVSQLDAGQVRETAIESLAENLNDSVVAPIFWFVVGGLPGAVLYRFANTADAMWGYPGMRGGRYWQWAGKFAARADDVLSFIPARITGLLLLLWPSDEEDAPVQATQQSLPDRLSHFNQQANLTPSPNSGWPMAAMALALGIRLRKPGVYALNEQGRAPLSTDTEAAISLAWRAVAATTAGAALVLAARGGLP